MQAMQTDERIAQIRQFWGNRLVTTPAETLEALELPAGMVEFLATVGLPGDPVLDMGMFGISLSPAYFRRFELADTKYLQIGEIKLPHANLLPGFETRIAVWLPGGWVNAIDFGADSGPHEDFTNPQFINSNLTGFLISLMLCIQHNERIRPLAKQLQKILEERLHGYHQTRNEFHLALEDLRHELAKADMFALSAPEHFWYEMIFDLSV